MTSDKKPENGATTASPKKTNRGRPTWKRYDAATGTLNARIAGLNTSNATLTAERDAARTARDKEKDAHKRTIKTRWRGKAGWALAAAVAAGALGAGVSENMTENALSAQMRESARTAADVDNRAQLIQQKAVMTEIFEKAYPRAFAQVPDGPVTIQGFRLVGGDTIDGQSVRMCIAAKTQLPDGIVSGCIDETGVVSGGTSFAPNAVTKDFLDHQSYEAQNNFDQKMRDRGLILIQDFADVAFCRKAAPLTFGTDGVKYNGVQAMAYNAKNPGQLIQCNWDGKSMTPITPVYSRFSPATMKYTLGG